MNRMPDSVQAQRVLLEELKQRAEAAGNEINVVIEAVTCGATRGRKSAFTFGYGAGVLEGIIVTLGLRYQMVGAPTWMKAMCSGVKPQKTTKARCLIAAQRLVPGESFIPEGCKKYHDGIVDAFLIAEYGRRTFE